MPQWRLMTLGREHRQNVGHRVVTARSVFVAKLWSKLGRFGDYLFPVPATKYLILLVGVRGFAPGACAREAVLFAADRLNQHR